MKLLAVIALAVGTFCATGCTKTIEPGYTGIKINKLGDNRGVSKENIVSGMVFYLPVTTKIVSYPTFNQRVTWTENKSEGNPVNEEITFNTKDQIRVEMDCSLNYTLSADKVPDFYVQFRADNISSFTHGYLRDVARNAVTGLGGEYLFEDLNGTRKEEFLKRVEAEINKAVTAYGVQIKQFAAIGALRPPEAIQNAVIAKTKSTQDAITAENQKRQIIAEAQKAVEQARGEAEANRIKMQAITPTLLEWEKLQIEKARIAKWKGEYPHVVAGGNAPMLYNLNMK